MPKKKTKKAAKKVVAITHVAAKRKNIPTVEYAPLLDEDDKRAIRLAYQRGMNNLQTHGRWAFADFTDVFDMQQGFEDKVEEHFNDMMRAVIL